jgi:uncharacterized LabA/DUF88 family protein
MPSSRKNNFAFIDGQNLHLGTTNCGWSVDFGRLRKYLFDKYDVKEAYYFLGYVNDNEQDLYHNLQRAGFILSFREHSSLMMGKKKGNIDTDLVFSIMRALVEQEDFDKVFIVSGDGDYKKLVDFLIKKDRFGKMLYPNARFASSLYNSLGGEFFDALDDPEIRKKIEYRRR